MGKRQAILLLAIAITSCGGPATPKYEQDPIDTGDFYVLDRRQFEEFSSKGMRGDAASSFGLYMHLASGGMNFGSSDWNAEYWLGKAAEQGDARAQQHLLVMALAEGTPSSCASARRTIEKYDLMPKIQAGQMRVAEQDLRNCDL